MTKSYDFLRDPLRGGDVLDDVAIHLHLLRELIPSLWTASVSANGDHILCRFPEWREMNSFLVTLSERALDHPTMIPYLSHNIDWAVTLTIEFIPEQEGAGASFVLVRPTLRLDRAAVVAIALTVAFDHWFEEGEDRSALIPGR